MAIPKPLKQYLRKNDFITLDEAREMGVYPMMLSRLVEKEELFRTERGIYTHNLDWLTDPLKKYLPACALIPSAVICGISALTYYDLTDEEERQIWIALPSHKKMKDPRFRVIRMSGPSYSTGITVHQFGNRIARIYDIEKTVVDAFKFLSEEAALKALKRYLKRTDKDIHKLSNDSEKLKKPLNKLIRTLLTDD